MYPENRNVRRYTCQARFFGSGGTFLFRGAVTDISRTGLCLSGVAPMAKGQSIHLKVELPAGTVDAVGEVRWVRPLEGGTAEVGLRFVRINQSSLEAIDETVAERERPVTSSFMRQYVFR
ncbi:MAG: PilZ domain-containing protein [Myxococcaceae bacterium]|nr:PilZ domain-containing protein [Myxococcaceae bacterium]